MSAKEAGSLGMVFTLGLAGLISGLALVGIYLVTQPMIEKNQADALEAAVFKVLPGAKDRKILVADGGTLVEYDGSEGRIPKKPAVFAGYDDTGKRVGFAIPAEGSGFQDKIKLIYGVDTKKGELVGMDVLESRETPGLGDKIVKDAEFVAEFGGLAYSPEIIPKPHGKGVEPNDVDCISGATISSKAVVKIINESNRKWLELLSGFTSEVK